MAKGGKYMTIYDVNDACFTCDICQHHFSGTRKSINLRFKLHCKKQHGVIMKEDLDFGSPGISIKQGLNNANLSTNKTHFSEYTHNSFVVDRKTIDS